MITKMKKVTFLVYHKEYHDFLQDIRDLGVVHVAERQQGTPESAELQDSIRLSSRFTSTIRFLGSLGAEPAVDAQVSPVKAMGYMEEVDRLTAEKSTLGQQLQAYSKERDALQAWGDFDPENINRLHDKGFIIGFYTTPEGSYNQEWEEKYHAIIINKISSRVYFVTITRPGEVVDLDVEPIRLPDYSLTQLNSLIEDTHQAMGEVDKKLSEIASVALPSLKAAQQDVMSEMEFSKVVLNTEQTAGDKLMLLQGWIPAERTEELDTYLQNHQIYYEISDPVPGDNVPIQLSNKGFFAWFEPISKLYMLPKYSELDLTPFFAPFFMVFFGLCLGDSGYGLFLFLGATLYRLFAKNIGESMKGVLSLVQILGISTFFCGLLTGTFFGFNLYNINWAPIQRLKDAVELDNNDLFQFSLILGVIQILFGMVLKAVNQYIQFGFKYAVATIGWILLLVTLGFSALMPEVLPMGSIVQWIILGVAGAMIFLCNSPDKNIFVNIGLGFWDSYNMATGLLGDILSYVRLFALGLSGGILASVFNSLAVGMSPDNIIAGPIVMVLIFVLGHALNMFMNVLGAMVHPMRLTFVEFFKNAGYAGGGKEYRPFRK
ncbi:MAG: V-type ATP synthase subunit I [Bacteroides sp.]|nr:V-type ATP synthase subunit I [Bacteroides sp.]